MKDRLASETEEERAARLQQMSANQCHRLATETEERAVRLQWMRDRLASETEEERATRLQQMSANQHHRSAAEAGSEREARLQRNREGQRGQQSQLPLFKQPSVQAKMRKFHAEIAALEMQKCTTCSEGFPGLQLRSHCTECVCCNRDKHVPKLYSSMNNMDTSRSARACASIAFELTLAPIMLCIHLVTRQMIIVGGGYYHAHNDLSHSCIAEHYGSTNDIH